MARIDENDLFKYQKLDTQYNDHYLISAFNRVLELIEGEHNHKETTLHSLMSCVKSSVNEIKELEKELKKKEKYITFLQDQLIENLNKSRLSDIKKNQ